MLAFGEHKAPIVAQAVEGEITPTIAASFLQEHPNALVVLDEAAADALTRYRSAVAAGPGRVGRVKVRKAVIWLARKLEKPILKLTEEDYNEDGLQDLLAEHGPAYDININVFRHLQATITGWPGGKPAQPSSPAIGRRRTTKFSPSGSLIFSPHPTTT